MGVGGDEGRGGEVMRGGGVKGYGVSRGSSNIHLDEGRLEPKERNVSTIISFPLEIPIDAPYINYEIGLLCCSDGGSKP